MAMNVLLVGIAMGGIYTLMALGLTLVYGVTRVFNFAQGSFFLWGGYIAWTLKEYTPLPYVAVFLVTVVIAFLFGMVFEKIFVSPLRRFRDWDRVAIIVTLGAALLLDSLALVIWGPQGRTLPKLIEGVIAVGDVAIAKHDLLILGISLAIVIVLMVFLRRTTPGKAIRAVPQDAMGANMVGISSNKVFNYVFGMTAAFGAIAGMLLSPRTQIYSYVGWPILVRAFVVVVFGGLGSIKGTVIAAFALAIMESFIAFQIGAVWGLPIFLGVLLLVLALRPKGLFGTW